MHLPLQTLEQVHDLELLLPQPAEKQKLATDYAYYLLFKKINVSMQLIIVLTRLFGIVCYVIQKKLVIQHSKIIYRKEAPTVIQNARSFAILR